MKKAFTLVELLFVMAIISILAGFAITNINESNRVALEVSMLSDARAAYNAQELYNSKYGAYANGAFCYSDDPDTSKTDINGKCTRTSNVAPFKDITLSVSKGNKMYVAALQCSATIIRPQILIRRDDINSQVYFNTCDSIVGKRVFEVIRQ